ncbi:MAG: serine protease [Methyloceanibacter sp.]|uniref:serine protease n=1 Tax=Methyloceanibacter sp. TaxID=1965321 RepID=UPI003D6D0BB1
MTRVQVLVANLLLGAGLLCGLNAPALGETDTEMIVGGQPAAQGKYPWQVRLYESMDDDIGFCGGSVIAPQWVLTAAHCLVDTEKVVVGYGDVDRTKTKKVESEKIIVHPAYLDGHKADIALVKLAQPIDNAPVIPLVDTASSQDALKPGVKATVTGWGAIWDFQIFNNAMMAGRRTLSERRLLDDEELQAPRRLHEVDIEVIDPDECKAVYESLQQSGFTIGDTEICATGPRGGKDSCYGDSGGPLVVPSDAPSGYVQVGIVSWGPQCGNPLFPGVYTRVSSFSDWIGEAVNAGAPATMSSQ